MVGALSSLFFLLSSYCFASRLFSSFLDKLFSGLLILSLEIYATAQVAGGLEQLGNSSLWLLAAGIFCLASRPQANLFRRGKLGLLLEQNLVFFPIFAAVLLPLWIGLSSPPGNWDGLSYYLPRSLYYLQFGSFADFPTSYWAQRLHPLLSPIWTIAIGIFGDFRENLFFLPNYACWIIFALALWKITEQLFSHLKIGEPNARPRTFINLCLGLFPLMELMQANIERNDMQVAAYSGIAIAFLLSDSALSLGMGVLALALALAAKSSALPIVPIAVLLLAQKKNWPLYRQKTFLALCMISLGVLGTCGYRENIQRYGNFLGPPKVLAGHQNHWPKEVLEEGPKNIFRFGIDTFTPDGLPGVSLADSLVSLWRTNGAAVADSFFASKLTEGRFNNGVFDLARNSLAHEDVGYLGLGYSILALIGAAGFFLLRRKELPLLVWGSYGLLIYLFYAFASPYDGTHGRLFILNGIFFSPPLTRSLELLWSKKWTRAVVAFALCLLFLQTIDSELNRNNWFFPFRRERLESVLRNRPEFLPMMQAIYSQVKPGSVLATKLPPDFPEYPLFGPHLDNIVIPTVDFERGDLGIPKNADWLLFKRLPGTVMSVGDMDLGKDFFLRKLK